MKNVISPSFARVVDTASDTMSQRDINEVRAAFRKSGFRKGKGFDAQLKTAVSNLAALHLATGLTPDELFEVAAQMSVASS